MLITRRDEPERLAALADALAGRVSALVGHSGVGKSTLVNALVPDADRAVGRVSGVGKGRHTTVAALALPLPADRGGWVVDTPGVRSFGLAHVTPDDVIAAFDDLATAIDDCPRGCGHLGPPADPECALDTLVEQGQLRAGRLAALRRVLVALRSRLLTTRCLRPQRTRIARHATRMVDGPIVRGHPAAAGTDRPEPGVEPDMHPRTVGPYTLLSVLGIGAVRPPPPGPHREGHAGRGPGDPPRVRRRPAVPRLPARAGRRRLPDPQPAGGRRARRATLDADAPWLATEYVPAPSIAVLLSRCGPLSVDGVRRLGVELAEALEAIHGAGAVHRDLKPGNVLVTGRRPAGRRRRHRPGRRGVPADPRRRPDRRPRLPRPRTAPERTGRARLGRVRAGQRAAARRDVARAVRHRATSPPSSTACCGSARTCADWPPGSSRSSRPACTPIRRGDPRRARCVTPSRPPRPARVRADMTSPPTRRRRPTRRLRTIPAQRTAAPTRTSRSGRRRPHDAPRVAVGDHGPS